MQPDYNLLWYNMNNNQTAEAHFYTFFEDSLNQFISTNSNSSQPVAKENPERLMDNLNGEQNQLSVE